MSVPYGSNLRHFAFNAKMELRHVRGVLSTSQQQVESYKCSLVYCWKNVNSKYYVLTKVRITCCENYCVGIVL